MKVNNDYNIVFMSAEAGIPEQLYYFSFSFTYISSPLLLYMIHPTTWYPSLTRSIISAADRQCSLHIQT